MKLASCRSLDYSWDVALPYRHADGIANWGSYRFFFYAGDRSEPRHVHVERDRNLAKFWFDPVRLQMSGGFGRSEISRIQNLVEENSEILARSWNEFFNR